MATHAKTGKNGKVQQLQKKVGGRPTKPGPKTQKRRSDITLPPKLIDALRVEAKKADLTQAEYHRLAVRGFAKYRLQNPVDPPLTECPACRRAFKAPRTQGNHKRLHVQTYLDEECVKLMDFLALTYYHGVFSQTFEAAVRWYMGDAAPPPDGGRAP